LLGLKGFLGHEYAHNIKAGDLVRTTVDLYNKHRGRYRIIAFCSVLSLRRAPTSACVAP
jgi:hypothetical protein